PPSRPAGRLVLRVGDERSRERARTLPKHAFGRDRARSPSTHTPDSGPRAPGPTSPSVLGPTPYALDAEAEIDVRCRNCEFSNHDIIIRLCNRPGLDGWRTKGA